MKVVYHYLSLLPVGWRWHNFPNWEYHSRIFATTYWPQGPAEAFEWLRIFLLDGRQEDEMACEGLVCGTTILLFVILLRFLRTYHGTRGNRTRGCSFLLSTTLTERRTKFCKKRIFPNGYFQTEMSVLEVWPAGLCERVPSSCNTWYFLLSPPNKTRQGRERKGCV